MLYLYSIYYARMRARGFTLQSDARHPLRGRFGSECEGIPSLANREAQIPLPHRGGVMVHDFAGMGHTMRSLTLSGAGGEEQNREGMRWGIHLVYIPRCTPLRTHTRSRCARDARHAQLAQPVYTHAYTCRPPKVPSIVKES